MYKPRPQICLRSILVKGYCMAIATWLLLALILCVFGLPTVGYMLFINIAPWLVRLAVVITCVLSISALKESI
jgi:hypothetical protein